MPRTARFPCLVCAAATAFVAVLPMTSSAQDEAFGPLTVPAIPATPFSAVGVTQSIRETADGNRFTHTTSRHLYRDSQGRTRVERELGPRPRPLDLIEIRDTVSGQMIILNPQAMTAQTIPGMHFKTSGIAPAAPEIFTVFGNTRIGPGERGWSAPVSLGEKSIDGIDAVGTRQTYTLAAGSTFGNDKPVTITVEQWYSPALGMILSKTGRGSGGGETDYHLEQIVQAEPDASLFAVPADYRRISLPTQSAGPVTSASAQ